MKISMRRIRPFLFLGLLGLMGCGPNYFLLHPVQPVPEIYRETEMFDRGQLRVYWLACYPDRKEPLLRF